ncbi:hypothetical protein JCM1840_006807 [Sporobolomyces johnsonii]
MTGHGGALDLPVVSFSLVDQGPQAPPDVDNPLLVSFGYNDGKDWTGYNAGQDDGGRYLRWLQPMESDLAKQVEYDMDEQDQVWLDAVNADRKKDGIAPVAYEVFEIVMDKIEKEWFDLTKSIPKKTNAVPTEDSKCAICDDGECENSNAIVFCDGCNLAVHQDCYGVPYIPEGQWLCRKCTVSPDKPVNCVLCPNSYGAFKQTTTGHWGHLLCGIWIPETGVSNTVYMEPIDGVETIPKSRWKLVCYLCKKRVGACIQCANRNCYTAYHVTCAREYGLSLKMKQGTERGELRSYCDKHGEVQGDYFANSRAASPAPGRLAPKGKAPPPVAASSSTSSDLLKLTFKLPKKSSKSKSARAYKKTFTSGPPVVPAFIFEKIMGYIAKIKIVSKKEFVNLVCRYWSLKREARRGAPLLKRIHLEPWTASATSRQQNDQDKAKKLELIRLLRNDLEKVRMLTEQVRKREKKKLDRAQLVKSVVDEFVFPKDKAMRSALDSIMALDKQQYFAKPVDRHDVPDYHDIIKCPMDWSTMSSKLDRHEYLSASDFQGDVHLVINNARRYNKPGTPVHRAAVKLLELIEPFLSDLDALDDHLSDPSVLTHYVAEVLTPKAIEGLFDFTYDTEDPTGQKRKRRDEAEKRRVKDAEEARAAEEAEEAKRAKAAEEAEQDERARQAREKGKGKAETKLEDEEMADADGHQPKPAAAKPAGKKRTAEVAELDAATTPVRPSPRTTRSNAAAEAASTPVVVSSRPNPRESARVRADMKAREDEKEKGKKGEVVTPASKRARKETEKGVIAPLPRVAPSETPKVEVQDVDPKDSFKMFETGWVLPEGSSRRKPPTPLTTTAALPPAALPPPTASTSRRTPRTSTAPLPSTPQPPSKPSATPSAPSARVSRKGKEKAVEEEAPVVDEEPTEVEKDAQDKNKGRPEAQLLREWQADVGELVPLVAVDAKTDLSDGVLVWHRSTGSKYPWYPAEVADPDGDDMPPALLKARPSKGEPRVPVLYFDDNRSGQWALRSELRLLGENAAFDKLLQDPLAVKWVRKRHKSTGKGSSIADTLKDIVDAYEFAMSNMMTEAEMKEQDAASKGKGGKTGKRAPGGKKKARRK